MRSRVPDGLMTSFTHCFFYNLVPVSRALARALTLITDFGRWPVSSVMFLWSFKCIQKGNRGWSGGAMVLGKLPVSGRPTIWIQ